MKLKSIKFITLAIASLIGIGVLATAPVFAADTTTKDICSLAVPDTVKEANGCNGSEDRLPTIVQNILNAIIGITGIIAVIFIIIGGVQYMTSTGDAPKVQKAKNTILYAVIGLIIVILAFVIVNWVINMVGKESETSAILPQIL